MNTTSRRTTGACRPGAISTISARSGLRLLLTASTLVLMSHGASAATYTWLGNGSTAGVWSDTTKWSGGAVPPTGNADTILSFTGTLNTTATDDILGTTFTVNQVTLINSSSNSNPKTITVAGTDATTRVNFVKSSANALPVLELNKTNSGGVVFSVPFTATDALTINSSGSAVGSSISGAIINNGCITAIGTSSTISSVISGAASLTINASGNTWTLSGASAFTGDTLVTAGTLALTNSGGTTLQNSALDLSGAGSISTTSTTLTFGGIKGSANLSSISGYAAVTALTLNPFFGSTSSYSGVISDGATGMTLTKTGLGTQVLSGTNTYTGATTINGGTLVLDYSSAATVIPSASAVTLGGGKLEFRGGATTGQAIASLATTANTGLNTLTVNKNGGSSTTVTSNVITRGAGSVLLLDLSSGGTFNTTKLLTNGVLDNGILVKDGTGRIDFATTSGGSVQALGATTALPAATGLNTNNYKLDGSQSQTATTASNTIRINTTGSSQALALGATNLGGTVLFVGADDYSVTGTGFLATATSGNAGASVFNMGAGKITLSAKLGNAAGNNLLVGNGSNLIDWNSTSNLTPSSSTTGATVVSNVTLRLSNSGAINLTNAAGSAIGTGSVTLNGAVLELASGDLTRNLNSGVAQGAITMGGTSSGFSAFRADRTVSLNSGASLTWGSTSGFLTNGATLILGSNFSDSAVDFSNSINLGAANRVVEVRDGVSTTNIDGKLSGIISGNGGGLIKTGVGALTLSNNNIYSGNTSVTNGTLNVTGSIVSPTTVTGASSLLKGMGTVGAVTLSSGGTLGGTLSTGAVTVQSGGVISPGNSPGTLTSSSATFLTGGSYTLQLNNDGSTGAAGTNWDSYALTGALNLASLSSSNTFGITLQTLDGSNMLGMLTSFDPGTNHTWASVIATGGITGTFASNLFAINTAGFQNGFNGTFSLVQDSGNPNNLDLIYTAVVPEPGTWAMMLGGLGVLVAIQRRRSTVLVKQ